MIPLLAKIVFLMCVSFPHILSSPTPSCLDEVKRHISGSNLHNGKFDATMTMSCQVAVGAISTIPSSVCASHSSSERHLAINEVTNTACSSSCNQTVYDRIDFLLRNATVHNEKLGRCNAVVASVHYAITQKGCPAWPSDPKDDHYTNVGFHMYHGIYQNECWKGCNATILNEIGKALQKDKTGESIGCPMVVDAIHKAVFQLKECPVDPTDPTDKSKSLLQNDVFGYKRTYFYQHCPSACGFQIGRSFKLNVGPGSSPCVFNCDSSTNYQTPAYLALNKTLISLRNDQRCKDFVNLEYVPNSKFKHIDTMLYNPFYSVNTTSGTLLRKCREAIYRGVIELSDPSKFPVDSKKNACERSFIAHKKSIERGICPPVDVEPWAKEYPIKGYRWRDMKHNYYRDYCGVYESAIMSQMRTEIINGADPNFCPLAKTVIPQLVGKKKIPQPLNVTMAHAYESDQYGYASLTRTLCAKGMTDDLHTFTKRCRPRYGNVHDAIKCGMNLLVDSSDSFNNPNKIEASNALVNSTHPPYYGRLAQKVGYRYCYTYINDTVNTLSKSHPNADICTLLKESIIQSKKDGYCNLPQEPSYPADVAHEKFPGVCLMYRNGCISGSNVPSNCTAKSYSFVSSVNSYYKIDTAYNSTSLASLETAFGVEAVGDENPKCSQDPVCVIVATILGIGLGGMGTGLFVFFHWLWNLPKIPDFPAHFGITETDFGGPIDEANAFRVRLMAMLEWRPDDAEFPGMMGSKVQSAQTSDDIATFTNGPTIADTLDVEPLTSASVAVATGDSTMSGCASDITFMAEDMSF